MSLLTASVREMRKIHSNIPGAVFFIVTRRPVGAKHIPEGARVKWVKALAPSEKLLKDFLRAKAKFRHFLPEKEAHIRAWEEVSYAYRYLLEIRSRPEAREWLKRIRDMLKQGRTVVLVCFCPQEVKPYCHRFILQRLVMGKPLTDVGITLDTFLGTDERG